MEDTKSGSRWVVLGLLCLNLFFCFVGTQIIPPLFSEIMKEIPLSAAQMGMVIGVIPLASLLFAPLGGGLSDKLGSRWVFAAGAVFVAVAGGLRYYSTSIFQFTACMFFIGAGIAIFTTLIPKVASTWFPPHQMAIANGIGMSSMQLGGAIGMALAVKVLAPTFGGWRGTTVAVAVASLAAGLIWAIFYRDRSVEGGGAPQEANMSENFKKVMKVREVWLIAIVYGIFMIDLMAIVTHLPLRLEQKGVANAGGYVGLWLMVAVVFNVVGGILSDIFGKRKPFVVFTAIIFGLCIPTFIMVTGVPLIVSIIISGAAAGAAVPVIMTIPAEMKQVGPALAGTSMGLIFMLGNAGGFVGPVVAGMLMDAFPTPTPAFIFMGAAIIIGGLLALGLPETGQKRKA